MKRILLTLSLFALSGCQHASTPKTTVIAPQTTAGDQPNVRWVKRGNVFYLELGEAPDPQR